MGKGKRENGKWKMEIGKAVKLGCALRIIIIHDSSTLYLASTFSLVLFSCG